MKKNLAHLLLAVFMLNGCEPAPSTSSTAEETASPSIETSFDESAFYDRAKLRKSVIEDIFKAGKNSITINGEIVNSMTDIGQELKQFDDAVEIIQQADSTMSDSVQKLVSDFKTLLKKTQSKEFPKLRKAFIKITDQNLWENNVDVGGTSDFITLTAGIFADHKNIRVTQEKISESLQRLRFKRAIYQWYNGANDQTTYAIASKDDADL